MLRLDSAIYWTVSVTVSSDSIKYSHSLAILYHTPCLIILFGKYCLALPTTTLPCVEAVDSVRHIIMVKEPAESGRWNKDPV